MRKRVSSNIRDFRFLFPFIGLLIIAQIIHAGVINRYDRQVVIVEIVVLFACVGLYFLFDHAKNVEFDQDFMYVMHRSGEEIIPLKDVNRIKYTMTQINNKNMWLIGYYDKNKVEQSVRILPRWFYRHFDEFKNCVRAANNEVKIKNYSHSFDIDQ